MRGRARLMFLTVVAVAAVTAGACGGSSGGSASDKPTGTLRLLGWEGYADPSWVKPFEKRYNAKVKISYVGSVDELFNKVRLQGANYDLAFPDASMIPRYVKAGLLQPLEMKRIKGLGRLQAFYRNQTYFNMGGKRYAVPYTSGTTPIIYNKTLIPQAPTSWNVLFDPRYKGKVGMLDDSNNMTVVTALTEGIKDPLHLTGTQFSKVTAKLAAQRSMVRKYYSGPDEGVNLLASGDVTVAPEMEPDMIDKVTKSNKFKFGIAYPKEGALAWVDNAVIPKGAANPALAYAYINWALSSRVQAGLANKYGLMPTIPVDKSLKPAVASRVQIAEKNLSSFQLLGPVEDPQKRADLWNRLRSGG